MRGESGKKIYVCIVVYGCVSICDSLCLHQTQSTFFKLAPSAPIMNQVDDYNIEKKMTVPQTPPPLAWVHHLSVWACSVCCGAQTEKSLSLQTGCAPPEPGESGCTGPGWKQKHLLISTKKTWCKWSSTCILLQMCLFVCAKLYFMLQSPATNCVR